jgi:hypothetical protein
MLTAFPELLGPYGFLLCLRFLQPFLGFLSVLASGRASLPALSGAVSQKILAAAKVVADPRSCLPRKDQPQAQSPRPRPYRRRDFASTGSGEALFKSLSRSQTDCAKYSKHYVRLSFLSLLRNYSARFVFRRAGINRE